VTIEFERRLPVQLAPRPEPAGVPPNEKSAFYKYRRSLTPEGGILIEYRDADRRWRITILRIILWTCVTYDIHWLLSHYSSLGWFLDFIILVLAAIVNGWIVRRPIGAARSIEIRSDCMIIDGTDVFWLSLIEDNWPELQPRDEDDTDDWRLYGAYGTRFVVFATAYRFGKYDATPETLANHVNDAMEKLWGDRSPNGRGPRSH
jgi:hypothetical protein